MEVNSKFNIGDEVYYMSDTIPCKSNISGISFFTGCRCDQTKAGVTHHRTIGNACAIEYYLLSRVYPIPEEKVFATKEELKESVFSTIEDTFNKSIWNGKKVIIKYVIRIEFEENDEYKGMYDDDELQWIEETKLKQNHF